jgi:hypothetical protein
MEARAPDAAETELTEPNDPAFIAERRRVRCLPGHSPERVVSVGLAERAELGTTP